jgi:hypothetical protein
MRIDQFPLAMSDVLVPICSCGRRPIGITFGFASAALALHKVGRSTPFAVAMRMEVAKRSRDIGQTYLPTNKLCLKKNNYTI